MRSQAKKDPLAGPISRPETPPPAPSSAAVRAVMVGNRGRDTRPEIGVRSALHAMGLRFRKNARPLRQLRCTADIVFPAERVAVFIDGCFWHSCPEHGRVPRSNSNFWSEKLERNAARDERNSRVLRTAGWCVLRYWEHEDLGAIATDVRSNVLERRRGGT